MEDSLLMLGREMRSHLENNLMKIISNDSQWLDAIAAILG